jgi:hypothetical protein
VRQLREPEAADLRARLQLVGRTQCTLEEEAASLEEERDHLPLERAGRNSTGSRLPSCLPLCSQRREGEFSEVLPLGPAFPPLGTLS